ncbi:MAG TPA: hypothetical protein VEK11_15210 [Thermoanaerobaculia bacterium]|jgi:hypothetical protein|nr:hypothetical protein [Thermoanaerobaculia bacterium]
MRKLIFVLVILCAVPLFACEDCDEYFDYQAQEWCPYCVATQCGFFNCDIRQYGLYDYCTGDDYGCFEAHRGCKIERTLQEVRLPQPAKLADTWRLASVRVITRAKKG